MIIPGYYYGEARDKASGSVCTFRVPGFHKGHAGSWPAVFIWCLPNLTHGGSQLLCWAGGWEDERVLSSWEDERALSSCTEGTSSSEGRDRIWERGNHPLELRISEAGRDLWKSPHLTSFPKAGSPSADCLGSPQPLSAICSSVWPSSVLKTKMILMFKWCFLVVF